MLFTRFNFSLSYWPGAKNVKPDALSRCYNPKVTTPEPETILPSSCLAMELSWSIRKQVREAQCSKPNSDNQMFVPDAVCSVVLEQAHSSRLAFVRQHLWWPTKVLDVAAFVTACTVFARNKTPRQRRRVWANMGPASVAPGLASRRLGYYR